MRELAEILKESSIHHRHLCPRQVLGARMALAAGELLGLELPRLDKRLLVIAETDGCTVDGIIAATGCRVGNRTLRLVDFGKVAATFTDILTGTSLRIHPVEQSRALAFRYAAKPCNRWQAMLHGYQVMPVDELFIVQSVELNVPLSQIISNPGRKAICQVCSEEIINGQEVVKDGLIVCRACVGEGYYHSPAPIQSSNTKVVLTSSSP